MSLTSQQGHIRDLIVSTGRRRGVSSTLIKAALETGLVESNLTNPSGGDADSAGWRQERARYYANPTDLRASINRFYDEALQQGGGHSWEIAANVQRPAAQFRGRYKDRASEAAALLRGGVPRGGDGGSDGSGGHYSSATVPGASHAGERQALLNDYFFSKGRGRGDLIGLATGLRQNQDEPDQVKLTQHGGGGDANTGAQMPGNGHIMELFWNGPGAQNWDEGSFRPKGYVAGHTDHVHVSAGPNMVVALGKLAQKMGLHVGENSHFGGVTPVHTKGSFHYKDEAIDVSGDPALEAQFARRVAQMIRGNQR